MTIADMKKDSLDEMGDQVKIIYGYKPPEYAVYSTDKRLMVKFSDDPTEASQQRKGLAPLNPLRGEINGLIDGWRLKHERSGLREKAARYDRRVADALVVALEQDVDSATTILRQIKQDILDDRTSWARLEYLMSALALSLVLVVVVWSVTKNDAYDLWRAAAAGALGAFFSIALSIRGRTILPDLRRTSNITDASIRIGIGFIAASVLMALVKARAITVGLGDAKVDSVTTPSWLFVLIVGFLAGFSERLVPDLLAKTGLTAQNPPATPQTSPMPAAEAGRLAAAAGIGAGPNAAGSGVGAAATYQRLEGGADDPAPEEAGLDHCACDIELESAEVTQDSELPAASGGVARVEGERPQ